MDIKTTKRTLRSLPPRHSVLLEANHGLGKSEIVAQTAAEMSVLLNKPFGFIDIRLGQYEVGDLIGMPRARDAFIVTNKVFQFGKLVKEDMVVNNVTVHDLPLWFPRDPDSYGYMFFDELNRGSRDTQQRAMQMVLDYKSNFVDIPQNWRVISACNDDADIYNVLGLDPALYSRFLVIKFRPTIPEWLDYAEKIEVHDAVVKYIRKFGTDLDCPEKMESGKRYPDRRSWVKLSNTIKYMIIRAKINEIVKSDTWGSMSAIDKEMIIAAQTRKINWHNILRQFYGNLIWYDREATRKRPNRRTGLIHPGSKKMSVDRHLVVVDTSGSIDSELLAQFLSVINQMTDYVPIDFMQCDCDIVEKPRPFDRRRREFEFKGRGGTDFQPIIDVVDECNYKSVVILTDGEASVCKQPLYSRVVWVLPEGSRPPVEWGMRVVILRY